MRRPHRTPSTYLNIPANINPKSLEKPAVSQERPTGAPQRRQYEDRGDREQYRSRGAAAHRPALPRLPAQAPRASPPATSSRRSAAPAVAVAPLLPNKLALVCECHPHHWHARNARLVEELLALGVERLDDLAGVGDDAERGLVRAVGRLRLEQLETANALVENAVQLLVQDHLRQLALHRQLQRA